MNEQQNQPEAAGGQSEFSGLVMHLPRLKEIGELLRRQDNRITDQPIFIVQQVVRDWGYSSDYAEHYAWLDKENDYAEADDEERERLEILDSACEDTGSWKRIYYKERWEFVTACFTEQGCKDFLVINGHNLRAPRIYAEGSYRNNEYRDVRKALLDA